MEKIAFIFPGQGSQSLGMLSDLYDQHSQVADTFTQASDSLGYDLWQLVLEGPEGKLNETQYTQPAILTASIALWRIWQDKNGKQPALLAGHSLGEYSALVAAQALDFQDAVKLVSLRGQFMQAAVAEGEGAMAAILGLDDAAVQQACEQAAQGEVVSAVNYNAPGQVVIAGQCSAVERAIALAKEAGAKRALPLPVSVPSHCALMEPAALQLSEALAQTTMHTPQLPVINNVNVAMNDDVQAIKQALVKQLYSPVRWVETIQAMVAAQCDVFVECGPGKVLSGLNKRIAREQTVYPIGDAELFDTAMST